MMGSTGSIDLGEFLRKAREAMGLTRDQIAAALKTTVGTVGRWERNESLPQRRLRAQLATELQISDKEVLRILRIVVRHDVGANGNSSPLQSSNSPNIDATIAQGLTRDQYVGLLASGLQSGCLTNEYFVLVAQVLASEVDFDNWQQLAKSTKR
jgi:transcriptional regulator with XRE-family HTH domain